MPLHLNSITNDSQNTEVLAWILQTAINESTGVFCTEDKQYIHMANVICNEKTGNPIGRFVFTLFCNQAEQRLEVLDLDIVLDNPNESKLYFLRRLPKSSDSNEYYEVEVVDKQQHLLIETVNRYTVPGTIEDTECAVRVSAFPFELSVYDSLQALNAWVGFDKVIDVGGTGLHVGGLSADFTAPGSAFSRKDDDGNYSFVVGTVNSYEDAVVRFGQHQFAFSIIWLDTAMGIIPVAAGREVFDLEKLEVGKVIGMNADIKCDFADYSNWHWQEG